MSSIKKTLILAATTILLLALCCGVVLYSQEKPEYGPQVVFVVAHDLENGKMRVIPKAIITLIIVPKPETHPAPLSKGTNMICRAYNLHASNGIYLALKCGADEYIVEAVGINPEK